MSLGNRLQNSISLYAAAETLDPDQITAILSHRADRSFRRGDTQIVRGEPHVRSYGSWALDSEAHVSSADFADHWTFIVQFVRDRSDHLAQARSLAPFRVRIFWGRGESIISEVLPTADLRDLSELIEAVDLSIV